MLNSVFLFLFEDYGAETPSTARREPPKLDKLTSGNPEARSPLSKMEAKMTTILHFAFCILHFLERTYNRERIS
jgi:hypothetical protein